MTYDIEYDVLLKCLLVGDTQVGKSSMLLQYSDQKFSQNTISTIGLDLKLKNTQINGKTVRIQIWDTAGQERFRAIASTYYRGSHCVFIVFDITSESTFKSVRHWYDEVKKNIPEKSKIILVGNKCDLEHKRMVDKEEAEELAEELGIQYFETSATDYMNISEFFDNNIQGLVEKRIYASNPEKLAPNPGSSKDRIINPSTIEESSYFCWPFLK
eukprot:gene1363-11985_t